MLACRVLWRDHDLGRGGQVQRQARGVEAEVEAHERAREGKAEDPPHAGEYQSRGTRSLPGSQWPSILRQLWRVAPTACVLISPHLLSAPNGCGRLH
jgi:hypothetical protein